MSNTLTRPPQEELAALVESGQAFANQVRAVTYKLNGQAYSSTVSALNQFDADLRRIRAAIAAEPPSPSSHVVGWQTMDTAPKDGSAFVAVDISRYPEIEHAHIYKYDGHPNYWHCRKHGICIRPDYQQRYRWAHLPTLAAATSEGGE